MISGSTFCSCHHSLSFVVLWSCWQDIRCVRLAQSEELAQQLLRLPQQSCLVCIESQQHSIPSQCVVEKASQSLQLVRVPSRPSRGSVSGAASSPGSGRRSESHPGLRSLS